MKHVLNPLRLFAACCAVVMLLLSLPLAASAEKASNPALSLQFKGDVNGDGAIDTTDARLILQYTVGKSAATLQRKTADVNGDWDINTTDARLVLQHAVGNAVMLYPQSLPYQEMTYTEPTGEEIEVTVREVSGGKSERDDSWGQLYVAQSVDEWEPLNAVYGFESVCNNTFFRQKAALVLNMELPIEEEPVSCRLFRNGNTLQISYETVLDPVQMTELSLWWKMLVEVPREALEGVESLVVYMDHRIEYTGELVVNEQWVPTDGTVTFYQNRVDVPMLAIMTALGAVTEPQGEGVTKITYNGKEYLLDATACSLTEIGGTTDLLAVSGYQPPFHTVGDELVVSSAIVHHLFYSIGADVTIEYDCGIVKISSE